MSFYPLEIQQLINLFTRLPGLGPKSAERIVFYLLDNHAPELTQALTGINGKISRCQLCGNYAAREKCDICLDIRRDPRVLAVVARPQDVMALEKSHEFHGIYHILGGLLSPLEGVTAKNLRIKELESRISHQRTGQNQPTSDNNTDTKEVILAFDATIEGETTALYIKKLLEPLGVKITRLARGLPVGADLEYADEVTLRDAIKNRQSL